MKIRTCVSCGLEMVVPKTSGKLRCTECLKEHNKEKARKWYRDNLRECRVRASLRQQEKRRNNPIFSMWTNAKTRAKTKGLPFDLELSDISIPEKCPILGTPFEKDTYYTASLDRIYPEKGYVKGNVQVVSHKANAMKNSASPDELLMFADWVYANVPEVTRGKR